MIHPGLFGIKHSNRNLSSEKAWGKNMFNATFPAALSAYLFSLNKSLIYLKLDESSSIERSVIDTATLFGADPQAEELHYYFEHPYKPYAQYVVSGKKPPVADLMLTKDGKENVLNGFEIKLTALPDEATYKAYPNQPEKWGCELVIRMPSIIFLACSICDLYQGRREELKKILGANSFGSAAQYQTNTQANQLLPTVAKKLHEIFALNLSSQKPALIQAVWKTQGKKAMLADNCLDVFVWSELAFTKLFLKSAYTIPTDLTKAIDRPSRAVMHLFFMIHDYAHKGSFNPTEIIDALNYGTKTDKAFSISGRQTNPIMRCPELLLPRVSKSEIKNIILGGGERFLSPERRFDAVKLFRKSIFLSVCHPERSEGPYHGYNTLARGRSIVIRSFAPLRMTDFLTF